MADWPSEEHCKQNRAFLARGHAFQSAAWATADFVDIELTHVYRQADREMVEHLQVSTQATDRHSRCQEQF
jgi:hypothetical protein